MARSPRQEFRKSVQSEIKARAVDEHGVRRCECCGYLVQVDGEKIEGARKADVDHKRACWTQSADAVKERPPLTANDGWLICTNCHKDKTCQEAFERMRTDGAGKLHAAHQAALAAKAEGTGPPPSQAKKIPGHGFQKGKRAFPKGRPFPSRGKRQHATN